MSKYTMYIDKAYSAYEDGESKDVRKIKKACFVRESAACCNDSGGTKCSLISINR